MMCNRRAHNLIFLFTALACAASARADLMASGERGADPTTAPAAATHSCDGQYPAPPANVLWQRGGATVDLAWPGESASDAAPEDSPAGDDVLTLPPGPSSARLLLWALGSMGAWQLGRSAHKLHLGNLPEWYHTGGPAQVGTATPLDLDFSLASLPLCQFEEPPNSHDAKPLPWWLGEAPIHFIQSQFRVAAAAPRGPPLHS